MEQVLTWGKAWHPSGRVLDAAHILPVKDGGQHRLDNRLLLRTDVHRLFDKGYVTVTPDGRFLVSRRLKDDFDNGEPYLPFHGQRIWLPGDPASQPNRTALEWHGDVGFWGEWSFTAVPADMLPAYSAPRLGNQLTWNRKRCRLQSTQNE